MQSATQYVIGIFALASLGLVSAELSAISPYVQVSTFAQSPMDPSSSILPKDWSVRVRQGAPGIEIVKERQRSVLKLRGHHSNVALYRKVHVDLDLHPNVSWERTVTEPSIHGNACVGQLDDQTARINVMFPGLQEFFHTGVWDICENLMFRKALL